MLFWEAKLFFDKKDDDNYFKLGNFYKGLFTQHLYIDYIGILLIL